MSNEASAHFALSLLHADRSDRPAAALELKRTIALAPYAAAAYNNLSNLFEQDRAFAEALGLGQRAARLVPADPVFHANLGSFCSKVDLAAEAVRHYRTSLVLDPAGAKACQDYGIILSELGRREEASRVFLRAVMLAPDSVDPVRHCVDLDMIAAGHPVRGALARLAARQDRLPTLERSALHFALGKSFADIGDSDNAFACWQTANELLRLVDLYDEAAEMRTFDLVTAMFPAEIIAAAAGQGAAGGHPVFIVGMPRCGSTLVEQILASHPQMSAGGETRSLGEMIDRHGAGGFRAVGEAYLAEMARLHPGARRLTDKMLGNYLRVGFIAAALPDARIVHIRRDPVDTCLSNYSHFFVENHPYATDLGELGRYYRRYTELMAHWRDVLPAGRMIELDYEALVDDLPGQLRRLLDFLDLPWDERCLSFHETERFVRTASQSQVRQPLYRTSVGRWHRYGAYIAPLIEGLGPAAGKPYMFGA